MNWIGACANVNHNQKPFGRYSKHFSMSGREFRKKELIDLLGQCQDVYELFCKSMVVVTGTAFDVVIMDA